MKKPAIPYIIDIEASGLGNGSYPIEIGLALDPGERFCTLIRPAADWEHWDGHAHSVHGIDRDTLSKRGLPVNEVAHQLNARLDGKVVFSDAWGLDSSWINTLYHAAGINKSFGVSALEIIMSEPQIAIWRETRDSVAGELGLRRHRASNDARIIQETYRRTLALVS